MDILSYVLGFNKGKAQGGGGAIKKDILPLEAVNFSKNMGGTYTGYFSGIFALKAGNTYYVEWDGETYKCEAFAHTDAVYSYVRLGNCSAYGGSSNDEPFTISIILDSLTRMVEALEDDKATHTISIYQIIGDSSDIDIKPLTITENGTYTAPEGEAYSPITVDVPSSGVTETDIFPLQTVEGFVQDTVDFGGAYIATSTETITLVEGETYYVKWDGTTYTCVAKTGSLDGENDIMYLGNDTLLGGTSDEPFTVAYFVGNGMVGFLTTYTDPSHNIRIYQIIGGSSADERVKYVTFMYGERELEKYPVIVGDTVRDRAKDNGWAEDTKLTGWVASPLIPSTDAKIYPVIGWSSADDATSDSDALENVTEDRTVYAVVMEKPRKYAVNFFDDAGKLVKSQRVAYGTSATPPDTFREGYIFNGWALSDGTISTDLVITSNTDFYGSWELDQGWIVPMTLPSGLTSAWHAKYTSDGTRLVLLANSALWMYDATTQPYTLLSSQSFSTSAYDLDISPDGKYVAIVLARSTTVINSAVAIYAIGDTSLSQKSSVIPSTAKASSTGYIHSCSFSADSSKLIVYHSVSGFFVFDVSTSSTWTYTSNSLSPNAKLTHLKFSPDSTKVVGLKENTAASKKSIYVLDVTNAYADVTETYITSPTCSYVVDYFGDQIAYSPDGRYLACVFKGEYHYSNSNTYLAVYDTTTTPYTEVKRVRASDKNVEATGVAFNGDGSLLAVARKESPYIEIYDTSTWELREAPKVLPTDARICCTFSANNHVFVGSTGTSALYTVKY